MDRLPPELFTQIMDNLPPVYIYRLRAVSRAWNGILSTQSMVRRTVKRAGLDVEDLEAQEQIMKNHIIFRPSKQFTWHFDLNQDLAFHENATLCGDLVICSAEIGLHYEELRIIVLDLRKRLEISRTIYVDRNDLLRCLFSDEIVVAVLKKGVKTELQWMTTGLDGVTKVDAPDELLLGSMVICGFIVAGFLQRHGDRVIWMYDALTNRQHYPDIPFRYEQVNNAALSLEADTITLWDAQGELNVRRYTLAGVLQFWKKYPVEHVEGFTVRSAGGGQYMLSACQIYKLGSWQTERTLFLIDLSVEYVETSPLSSEWAVCWRGRWIQGEQNMLTVKDDMEHRLAWDGRFVAGLQMNDRWFTQKFNLDDEMFGIHVLDFHGTAKTDKVIERDGGHENVEWTWERI